MDAIKSPWVPKYTLAELTSMRTKPYLGFIPRTKTWGFATRDSTHFIRDAQIETEALDAGDNNAVIEIGKSLIFHTQDWDFLAACTEQAGLKLEHNAVAKLLLACELFSYVSIMEICCIAINCAYKGYVYGLNNGNTGSPVWEWPHMQSDASLITMEMGHIHAKLQELAAADKRKMSIRINDQYSERTLEKFLTLRGFRLIHRCTVKEYIKAVSSEMPNEISLLVRKCKLTDTCVECAIAALVERKCSQCKDVTLCASTQNQKIAPNDQIVVPVEYNLDASCVLSHTVN
jgi:hypothetical protein